MMMLSATIIQLMMQIQPVFELTQLGTGVHPYNIMMIAKYDHMRIGKWRTHISVARVVCLVEHKQNMSTGHLLDEGRNQPHEQVIKQIGYIY